jgi:hypothetical protein
VEVLMVKVHFSSSPVACVLRRQLCSCAMHTGRGGSIR